MASDRLGEFEELLLLGMRALGDETYGVPLQRYLSSVTGHEVSMGAVYATLDRLEHKGLLRSALGKATPERGGKRRRMYTVTPAGTQALRNVRRLREKLWQAFEDAK